MESNATAAEQATACGLLDCEFGRTGSDFFMDNIIKPAAHGEGVILLASRSRAGGGGVFPRIPADSPAAVLYEDTELVASATLYSYTVVHPNPKTGEVPFVLALADYPDGTRVFGRLDHPAERVRIGMTIEARASQGREGDYRFVQAGVA